MSKTKQKSIEVYAHWRGLSDPVIVGSLYVTISRGKEIFSFEYDENWLKKNQAHTLGPSLQLFQGQQYAPQGMGNGCK